jgi:hypothetical protein
MLEVFLPETLVLIPILPCELTISMPLIPLPIALIDRTISICALAFPVPFLNSVKLSLIFAQILVDMVLAHCHHIEVNHLRLILFPNLRELGYEVLIEESRSEEFIIESLFVPYQVIIKVFDLLFGRRDREMVLFL